MSHSPIPLANGKVPRKVFLHCKQPSLHRNFGQVQPDYWFWLKLSRDIRFTFKLWFVIKFRSQSKKQTSTGKASCLILSMQLSYAAAKQAANADIANVALPVPMTNGKKSFARQHAQYIINVLCERGSHSAHKDIRAKRSPTVGWLNLRWGKRRKRSQTSHSSVSETSGRKT